MHHFFFHSITATDSSKESTTGRVASPRSIMVHHGFRSNEARCAGKQNIYYTKQHHTPHCWLPAKVIHPANSSKRFSWSTHSTPIFIVVTRTNMYIYIYIYRPHIVKVVIVGRQWHVLHAEKTLFLCPFPRQSYFMEAIGWPKFELNLNTINIF